MTDSIKQNLGRYFLWTGFALWIIGFFCFSLWAISFKYTPVEKADAIIVLTGGPDRISSAIHLLENQNAPQLFISGVNKVVKEEDLLKKVPPELRSKIHLGYMADSTYTNALESSDWIQQNNLKTIILLTSFYHMPRSLIEMHQQIPNLKIYPYSIFPNKFENSTHWLHTNYAWQLFLEYHKFLITYSKYFIKRIIT